MRLQHVLVGELTIAYATTGKARRSSSCMAAGVTAARGAGSSTGSRGDFAVAAWEAPGCGQSADPPGSGDAGVRGLPRGLARGGGASSGRMSSASRGELARPRALPAPPAGSGLARPRGRVRGLGGLAAARGRRGAGAAGIEAELERPPAEWAAGYLPGILRHRRRRPSSPTRSSRIMCDLHPCRHADDAARDGRGRPARRPPADRGADACCSVGRARRPLAPRVAEELHAGIPGSELVVLPGVGHFANAERPDEFNAAVRSFLLS